MVIPVAAQRMLYNLKVIDLLLQIEDSGRSVARLFLERENGEPFLLVAVLGKEQCAALDAAHQTLLGEDEG